jgi:hypothetical protein
MPYHKLYVNGYFANTYIISEEHHVKNTPTVLIYDDDDDDDDDDDNDSNNVNMFWLSYCRHIQGGSISSSEVGTLPANANIDIRGAEIQSDSILCEGFSI